MAAPAVAAPADLNAAFIRLGFSDVATAILADAEKENIDIEALILFDDKGVKTLCATMRKPGGTVEGVAAGGGGERIRLQNPGVYVSTKAEMNMTVACYMARHYHRTTRTMAASLLPADHALFAVQGCGRSLQGAGRPIETHKA